MSRGTHTVHSLEVRDNVGIWYPGRCDYIENVKTDWHSEQYGRFSFSGLDCVYNKWIKLDSKRLRLSQHDVSGYDFPPKETRVNAYRTVPWFTSKNIGVPHNLRHCESTVFDNNKKSKEMSIRKIERMLRFNQKVPGFRQCTGDEQLWSHRDIAKLRVPIERMLDQCDLTIIAWTKQFNAFHGQPVRFLDIGCGAGFVSD